MELLLLLMVEALLAIGGQTGDPEIKMTAVSRTTNLHVNGSRNPPRLIWVLLRNYQMELIQYHGYRGEEHSVNTSDGYVLTMHRIPCPKSAATDNECK